MPYKLKGKCVVKKDTGEVVKCHPTRKKALKHLVALRKNVSDAAAAADFEAYIYDQMIEIFLDGEAIAGAISSGSVTSENIAASNTDVTPVLVTVPNVTLMEAGVEYALSTGPATFTPEDLRDAVTAANEDPAIPLPRLKLGHIDPRYNHPQFDGDPAFGKATNLRLSSNGMSIIADYVGVPKWLANIMATAYPSRSIEGYWGVESQSGHTWKFVLSAVACLGVKWPGITQLEDLPMYYGEEVPDDVEIDEELIAAAREEEDSLKLRRNKEAASTGVEAAANLDDIRRAFYNDYMNEHRTEGSVAYWWVRAVMTDPNQLVIEDDTDGQLYLLPFSSDAKGSVSFGDPSPVRIDYVPDDRKKEAAASITETLLIGHEVAASWPSRDESVPATATEAEEGGHMDPKEIRAKLGLAEDASDDEVKLAIVGMANASGLFGQVEPAAAAATDPPIPAAAEAQAQTEPQAPAAPPAAQPEPVAAAPEPGPGTRSPRSNEPVLNFGNKPMTTVDTALLEGLVAKAQLGEQAWERLEKVENDRLLDAAMASGKFPPSRRDAWEQYMKVDPEGAKAALNDLQEGIIPVTEIGATGAPDYSVPAYPIDLFPEIKKRLAREEQVNAGVASRPRVQTDGAMRRGGILRAG